jgi:hypothetical protein
MSSTVVLITRVLEVTASLEWSVMHFIFMERYTNDVNCHLQSMEYKVKFLAHSQ